MRVKLNGPVVMLAASLVAVGIGIFRTNQRDSAALVHSPRATTARGLTVDQTSLDIAVQLVRQPTTSDERPFADEALRIADQEMDLAFAQAVRIIATRPPAVTAETKALQARAQQATRAVANDQAQIATLTAAAAKASATNAQSIGDQLELAKAQLALDQDELDDARQDLARSGADPQARMQQIVAQHDAASRSSDSVHVNVVNAPAPHGLIHHLAGLQSLYAKESELDHAKATADSLALAFKQRHDRLEARTAGRLDGSGAGLSHDSSRVLIAATQQRALSEKARAALDQRVDDQHQLADVYTGWIAVVRAQERTVINRALRSLASIILIILVAVLFFRWMEHALGGAGIDRRRAQTLDMVARVTLQVLAVLLILLVIFGPPNNLGTFLGLAGAGLTVALKDFIVGFLGWFVLMGKNGIRIGDFVEVNGVTGEVVELGMFYTVLLETSSWSESGHPTGRRVTFNNGFAIEGHYINFSTSGQWLWDEIQIIVPAGQDPYPIVDTIQKQIEEATADGARQAELHWKHARRSPHLEPLSAAPSITLKPIAGGTEITARYITHMTDRSRLRASLYQTAVDLLGGKHAPALPRS